MTTHKVFLSLGTNLGDREANLDRALLLLSEKITICRRSSLYETEPVGFREQPWFFNLVAEGNTALSPEELLSFTQSVEHRMKRVKTMVNGPRIIDVDLLLYDDAHIQTDHLVLPHPRMLERSFVMTPLLEVAPDLVVSGQTVREYMKTFAGEKVRRRSSNHGTGQPHPA